MITAETAISAILMLRDQAIEPELASFAKQVRPDLALLEFRDKDTSGRRASSCARLSWRIESGRPPQIVTVNANGGIVANQASRISDAGPLKIESVSRLFDLLWLTCKTRTDQKDDADRSQSKCRGGER
jgi:hypothetical protein